MSCRHYYAFETGNESAFSVDATSLLFGPGLLREVGQHVKLRGLKKIAVFTDRTVRQLQCLQDAIVGLREAGIDFEIFDEVRIEPNESSISEAIRFATAGKFDGYISVGGGSVIDTCKIANLHATYPADLMEYVSAPFGKGAKVPGPIQPHFACPTTCGTGTEATPAALFKYTPKNLKVVVVSPFIKPTTAFVDPTATYTLPKNVVMSSAFDILSHAIESYTARPYTARPKPNTIQERPLNAQGANPWADMGCETAVREIGKFMVRAINDPSDHEARDHLAFAATLAGIAIGSVGTHVPHAMSYGVAGHATSFHCDGYPQETSKVPHGISVIATAPSVFRFNSCACPDRHLNCAEFLGADIRGAAKEDAGEILATEVIKIMKSTGAPNGIAPFGYSNADVDHLSEQVHTHYQRILKNSPRPIEIPDLQKLFLGTIKYW